MSLRVMLVDRDPERSELLEQALAEAGKVIEKAKGLLMKKKNMSEDAAYQFLRKDVTGNVYKLKNDADYGFLELNASF